MSIISDLTPAQYELFAIRLVRSGGDVLARADMRIRSASGKSLAIRHPSTTLTPGEKTALLGFVNRELAAFEALTGLTEWAESEEEGP